MSEHTPRLPKRLRQLDACAYRDSELGGEAADLIEQLQRETVLLREYVALLERACNDLTAFAHARGMISPPRDVAEGKRLREAIRLATNEHDEAVVDELFADAPKLAGRAAIAEARGEGDG